MKSPSSVRGRLYSAVPQPINLKGNFSYGWVPLEKLRIDPIYQRDRNTQWVVKHGNQFDPDLMGVIVVSLRSDGFYYIVDGQHRYWMLMRAANTPKEVFAQIFKGLTVKREADLFDQYDNERRNLTSGVQFNARLVAERPLALGIIRAVERAGMTMSYRLGPVPGNVRAYKTVEAIYHRSGESRLNEILDTLHKAWPDDNKATAHQLLRGMEDFIDKYDGQYNKKHLIQVLSNHNPNELLRLAYSIQGTFSSVISAAVGMTILALYNKNLRTNRLPEWSS